MRYISTRNDKNQYTLSEAIHLGLAKDGGLFMPETFPSIQNPALQESYSKFAETVLFDFFKDDTLAKHLSQISTAAFNFPIPIKKLNQNTYILELFHGPTSSFKDFGARFLAQCMKAMPVEHESTIMVATSGDTGSAVASAFYQMPNIRVIILFPKGGISKKQEHQLTCWDKNVTSFAVKGTFDDCQALVKKAFQDPTWQEFHLTSANSINIGRLLPQITYYAYSSLQLYQQTQKMPGFIIPTGNLGNATAAYWAKAMGFPIREIVLATNANTVIPEYLQTEKFTPRPSIPTLANAMDVGNPSNFERLKFQFHSFDQFKQNVKAFSATDEDIKKTILSIYEKYGEIICPHTACGFYAKEKLSNNLWVVVATADPSKFDNIIEPIIHQKIPNPPQLAEILKMKTQVIEVEPELEAIKQSLT